MKDEKGKVEVKKSGGCSCCGSAAKVKAGATAVKSTTVRPEQPKR